MSGVIDVIKNDDGYHVGKAAKGIFYLYNTVASPQDARRLAEEHSIASGLPVEIVSEVARQDLYPEAQ